MGCTESKDQVASNEVITSVAPAQQSFPKNKVVPLPTDGSSSSQENKKTAGSSQADGSMGTHASLKANGSHAHGAAQTAAAAAHAGAGLPDYLRQLHSSKHAYLHDLANACVGPAGADSDKPMSTSALHAAAAQLQQLSQRLPGIIERMQQTSEDLGAPLLKAAAAACAKAAEALLAPVISHIERLLSHSQASSSAAATAAWDAVDIPKLLQALDGAAQAAYPAEPGAAATRLQDVGKPAAVLLGVLWHLRRAVQAGHVHIEDSALQVPAVRSLASMVNLIFFRKVILDSSSAIAARAEQLDDLLARLGGWTDQQLAAGIDPHGRAALMAARAAAAAGSELRLKLTVRRSTAFWDALQQWQAANLGSSSNRQPCKVFPSFVDELAAGVSSAAGSGSSKGAKARKPVVEAGEGHGPRKEFFALAGANMAGGQQQQNGGGAGAAAAQQKQQPALFLFNRTAGAYWYNTMLQQSAALEAAYRFGGWLVGQSLLNHAPLGLALPPVLFQALPAAAAAVGGKAGGAAAPPAFAPGLADLERFDPAAATAVRNVAAMPASQLREFLEVEGLPGSMSGAEYAAHAARDLLVEQCAWQAAALAAGLYSALDAALLRDWCLDPEGLAAAAAGGDSDGAANGDVDIRSAFRVIMDAELRPGGSSEVLGQLLWKVVGGWPSANRVKLVEFITGSSRLPVPGSEMIKVECPFVAFGMSEHRAQLGMLPQAHTCDNLMELPNYWQAMLQVKGIRNVRELSADERAALEVECAKILDDRLTLAVTSFQGYGLDERDGDGDDSVRGSIGGSRRRRGSGTDQREPPAQPRAAVAAAAPPPPPLPAADRARTLYIDAAEHKDATLISLNQSIDPFTPMTDLSAAFRGVSGAAQGGGFAADAPGGVAGSFRNRGSSLQRAPELPGCVVDPQLPSPGSAASSPAVDDDCRLELSLNSPLVPKQMLPRRLAPVLPPIAQPEALQPQQQQHRYQSLLSQEASGLESMLGAGASPLPRLEGPTAKGGARLALNLAMTDSLASLAPPAMAAGAVGGGSARATAGDNGAGHTTSDLETLLDQFGPIST